MCNWGAGGQVERMDSVAAVRRFKFRIVVATDLAARGLDLPAVNLVRLLSRAWNGPRLCTMLMRGTAVDADHPTLHTDPQ